MGKTEKINNLKIKAKTYLAKNKLQEATSIYEKILELSPEDPAILNEAGEVFKKAGNTSKAKELLWNSLEGYEKLDYYPNAIAVAQKLLKLGEDELQLNETLARLYSKQGLIGDAISSYYSLAEKYKKEGDIDGVLETYKKIIELTPKKTDTRMKLAEIFLSQNKNTDAIEQLKEVEKIYREQGRVDDADQVQKKIIQIGGKTPSKKEKSTTPGAEVIFEQSKTIFEEEKTKKESSKAKTMPSKPEVAPLETEKEKEGSEKLESILNESTPQNISNIPEPGIETIERSVTDWVDWVTLGELYESVQSIEEAVEYYTKAADYFFEINNFDKAKELYKKIADLKPYGLRSRQRLIQIALKEGNTAEATTAYISLYECLKNRGATEEAKKTLEKVKKLAPDNPELLNILQEEGVVTEIEIPKGEEILASIDFDKLLEEESATEVKEEKNKEEAAIIEGEENIESLLAQFKQKVFESISAEDYSSHYDLGFTYKEMGLLDEAIREFKIAMRGEKEKLKSLEMLGICYEEKGEPKLAEAIYRKTLEREKGQSIETLLAFHYHLGDLYLKQGDTPKALKEFKTIVKVNPNFGDVKKKIKELSTKLTHSKKP